MGHICEVNRGVGRGFMDEGGSARIRAGEREVLQRGVQLVVMVDERVTVHLASTDYGKTLQ